MSCAAPNAAQTDGIGDAPARRMRTTVHAFCFVAHTGLKRPFATEAIVSDLMIPYWMWAVSLIVLALVCGAALSAQNDERRALRRQRVPRRRNWRVRW